MTLGIIERNPTVNDMKRAAWINAMTRNVHTRLCSSFSGEKVHGVVGQDRLAGRARHERRRELARDVALDLVAQREMAFEAGEVVTHDDVERRTRRSRRTSQNRALSSSSMYRSDQVRVVGNDLERRIAAIHLPVHLRM